MIASGHCSPNCDACARNPATDGISIRAMVGSQTALTHERLTEVT